MNAAAADAVAALSDATAPGASSRSPVTTPDRSAAVVIAAVRHISEPHRVNNVPWRIGKIGKGNSTAKPLGFHVAASLWHVARSDKHPNTLLLRYSSEVGLPAHLPTNPPYP
jgi:hypothetical protein